MLQFGKYSVHILRRITKISKPVYRTMAVTCGKKDQVLGADPTSRLIWLDLELTGLNIEKDVILEAYCVITEANLDIVAEGPRIVIHQPDEVLDGMVPWCQDTHRKSGLIGDVMESSLSLEKSEDILLDFVRHHTKFGACPLAGNTVYMDRLFLAKHMPKLNEHMHYRLVDVSTVKELCRRWNHYLFAQRPDKTFTHRAAEDVLESIAELKYYKSVIFDPHSVGNKDT